MYRVPRSQIAYVINMLLDDVFVVDEDVVRCANKLFGTTILDYLDCLSAARSIVRGENNASFEKPLLGRVLNQQMESAGRGAPTVPQAPIWCARTTRSRGHRAAV